MILLLSFVLTSGPAALVGCVLGFVCREVMAFTTRRNDLKVSFRYYWSLSKNRWTLILNVLMTAMVMIGRNELINAVIQNPDFVKEWPNVSKVAMVLAGAPFWTGAGIGLFGAFLLRWVITTLDQRFGRSKKIREGDPAMNDDKRDV